MYMNADIASVFDLSPAEKLQLVQDLWDDLAANPQDVPFYSWQEEELDRRQAHLEAHPESALTCADLGRGQAADPRPLWPLSFVSPLKQGGTSTRHTRPMRRNGRAAARTTLDPSSA
jgi:putative addiction module component (TIGR02574 family)